MGVENGHVDKPDIRRDASAGIPFVSDIMHSNVLWCRVRDADEESLSVRQHRHSVHELHYIYEGRLCFDFNGAHTTRVCEVGDTIFIPSGIVHSIEDLGEHTRKLVVGFDVSTENAAVEELFNQADAPVVFMETPWFHDLAQAIPVKSATDSVAASASIGCMVHVMLLEILETVTPDKRYRGQRFPRTEDSQRADKILSFIRENVFNDISVEKVADAVGLSPRQASRVCAQLFDCSLNQLIVRTRLKEICTLLTDSKYSIADIAELTGFATPYSFSRHFSHYTGVTPSAYRKNYELQKGLSNDELP